MIIKKNYHKDFPSWDSLLNNFNQSLTKKKIIKHNESFLVSHEAIEIPEVKKFALLLGAKDAHLYMSFLPKAKGLGRHKDRMDVGFWQVKGKSLWNINDKSAILEEGDYLFIPKGTYHEVIGLNVRAGISYGF